VVNVSEAALVGATGRVASSMTIITRTDTIRYRLLRNIHVLLNEIESTKRQPAACSMLYHRRGGRGWLVKIMCGILIQAGLMVLVLSRPVVRALIETSRSMTNRMASLTIKG
jgi:hypothetical protein